MLTIVFYVSGHGYGHAVRIAEVISKLMIRHPASQVHIRTMAPASIFAGLSRPQVQIHNVSVDTGVVEGSDALVIDAEKSLEQVESLFRRSDSMIANEKEFLRRVGANVVVSDIPFLAGDIACACGVACVAIGNFTWDWIYDPYFEQHPRFSHLRGFVCRGYSRMEMLLQLPFGHEVSCFPRVVPVPLIARAGKRDPEDILGRLAIPVRTRPLVFLGMRAAPSGRLVETVAEHCREFIFLTLQQLGSDAPENLRRVVLGDPLEYPDVLRASDVVVSKLGYGIVADCFANETALLWPARRGFREDGLLRTAAEQYLQSMEIPVADFAGGRWGKHLRRAMEAPRPDGRMPTNGAEVCADRIAAAG
jgi:hypothetical protein